MLFREDSNKRSLLQEWGTLIKFIANADGSYDDGEIIDVVAATLEDMREDINDSVQTAVNGIVETMINRINNCESTAELIYTLSQMLIPSDVSDIVEEINLDIVDNLKEAIIDDLE